MKGPGKEIKHANRFVVCYVSSVEIQIKIEKGWGTVNMRYSKCNVSSKVLFSLAKCLRLKR